MQLPIGEHLPAAPLQVAGHLHAAAGQELQADLVEQHAIAQPLDHGFGVGAGGHVERQDQARVGALIGFAGGLGGGHGGSSEHAHRLSPAAQKALFSAKG